MPGEWFKSESIDDPEVDWCSVPAEAGSQTEAPSTPIPALGWLNMSKAIEPLSEPITSAPKPPGPVASQPLGPIALIALLLLDKSNQTRGPLHPNVRPTDVNPQTGTVFRDLRQWGEYQHFSLGQIDRMVQYSAQHCRKQLQNSEVDRQNCSNAGANSAVESCALEEDPASLNDRRETKALPSKTKEKDKDKTRYTVAVHAQGTDCGGKTSSTIGAPAITKAEPITVAQGLDKSRQTQALLSRTQLRNRTTKYGQDVISEAHDYIITGPANGGRFGPRSFVVRGVRGGIRYDVDCWGDGPSFVS